jgi:hypothetical protein
MPYWTLPGPEEYPPLCGLTIARVRTRGVVACVKCRSSTVVGYAKEGRLWPCCLRCARRAAKVPCPCCGDTSPIVTRAWHPLGAREGRTVYHHESGAMCSPLEVDEWHEVRCSSCQHPIRFRLIVLPARIAAGVSQELACACGARWGLETTSITGNVYFAQEASA